MLEPIEYRKTMSRLKRQVLDPSSKSMLRTLYYPLGIKTVRTKANMLKRESGQVVMMLRVSCRVESCVKTGETLVEAENAFLLRSGP